VPLDHSIATLAVARDGRPALGDDSGRVYFARLEGVTRRPGRIFGAPRLRL